MQRSIRWPIQDLLLQPERQETWSQPKTATNWSAAAAIFKNFTRSARLMRAMRFKYFCRNQNRIGSLKMEETSWSAESRSGHSDCCCWKKRLLRNMHLSVSSMWNFCTTRDSRVAMQYEAAEVPASTRKWRHQPLRRCQIMSRHFVFDRSLEHDLDWTLKGGDDHCLNWK